MPDRPPNEGKDARAERLAARLRDNLRRRKAQARGQSTEGTDPQTGDDNPRG